MVQWNLLEPIQQWNSGFTRLSHLRDEKAECHLQNSDKHCLRDAPRDVSFQPLAICQEAGQSDPFSVSEEICIKIHKHLESVIAHKSVSA